MAYFKLEFGFGRSKSEGKISDTANLVDEQVALEIPGWDFVNDEVERAKQQGRFNPHCSHPSCNSLISNIQIF